MVECFLKRLNHDCPILARVKYLFDYGIDNCNPVLLVCQFMSYQQSHFLILFSSSRFTHGPLEKPYNSTAPYVASCLTSRAVPVEFHNCSDSVTRVARKLRVPTICSRDILHQAIGGSSWQSPLRPNGSRDNQAGEAGTVEAQLSGGQESQNQG